MANNLPYFSSGQNITLRMVWRGKVWAAWPQIVVQDTPELTALYIMPGALWKSPATASGGRVPPSDRAQNKFVVKDETWRGYFCLRLKIPGSDYSVMLFSNPDKVFIGWYINLETPFQRFNLGFDYIDEELDIILKPDLSSWYWKDEDETAEAVACGLISKDRASYLYAEGERVVKWIQSGKSPFNGWENWRPDPMLQAPVLPQGWDVI